MACPEMRSQGGRRPWRLTERNTPEKAHDALVLVLVLVHLLCTGTGTPALVPVLALVLVLARVDKGSSRHCSLF